MFTKKKFLGWKMLDLQIESESNIPRQRKNLKETEAIMVAERKNCIVAFYE